MERYIENHMVKNLALSGYTEQMISEVFVIVSKKMMKNFEMWKNQAQKRLRDMK